MDLLHSVDETLLEFVPSLDSLGLLDVSMGEITEIDDTTLKTVLDDAPDIPSFAKLEICEGLRRARERIANGATAVDGTIATPVEAARMRDWIEAILASASATT